MYIYICTRIYIYIYELACDSACSIKFSPTIWSVVYLRKNIPRYLSHSEWNPLSIFPPSGIVSAADVRERQVLMRISSGANAKADSLGCLFIFLIGISFDLSGRWMRWIGNDRSREPCESNVNVGGFSSITFSRYNLSAEFQADGGHCVTTH